MLWQGLALVRTGGGTTCTRAHGRRTRQLVRIPRLPTHLDTFITRWDIVSAMTTDTGGTVNTTNHVDLTAHCRAAQVAGIEVSPSYARAIADELGVDMDSASLSDWIVDHYAHAGVDQRLMADMLGTYLINAPIGGAR